MKYFIIKIYQFKIVDTNKLVCSLLQRPQVYLRVRPYQSYTMMKEARHHTRPKVLSRVKHPSLLLRASETFFQWKAPVVPTNIKLGQKFARDKRSSLFVTSKIKLTLSPVTFTLQGQASCLKDKQLTKINILSKGKHSSFQFKVTLTYKNVL